ncbi:MAG: chorismate mutase [Pseudomonadota bacterium]
MSEKGSQDIPQELEEYRKQIDECDAALIKALAERFEIVRKVGALKVGEGMDSIQPARAQAVKDQAVELGKAHGLDEAFMRRIYDALIDYAHHIEHEIIGDHPEDEQ